MGAYNKMKQVLGYLDPDRFGETYYLVDADFRTFAQGWTNYEGTGPVDLYNERNKGRVFYTPGVSGTQGVASYYTTDSAALQAANDACTDFRGDKIFFTPGSYALGAAVTLDVPDLTLTGRRVQHCRLASATVTATVAAALSPSAAADRLEVAFLRFVPLTAATVLLGHGGGGQSPLPRLLLRHQGRRDLDLDHPLHGRGDAGQHLRTLPGGDGRGRG